MSKPKKLIVITSGSYPYGGAATNRHLSYLKGLVELGVEVKMIILQPAKQQSPKSNKNQGVFNYISYQYAIPYNTIRSSVYSKITIKLQSVYRALQLLKKEIELDKEIRVLILIADPLELLPFLRLSKKNNIEVFHERTEFPFIGKESILSKLYLKYYLKVVNKFDGIFLITNALVDYFSTIVDKKKLIHIPMTVEPERFNCGYIESKENKYGKYIAYCGSMYTDKDGVPILVKAFDIFADKFEYVNLVLIGDNSNTVLFKPIADVISTCKHKDRIILTGQVERDEMPSLLCNAEALALARPNNIQAKGGFPTKLGEYLATGRPVAVTSVGEIPLYLSNKNAFMSSPNSENSFSSALIKLYSDYENAKNIGAKGKILSRMEFNYRIQSQRIFDFIYNK